MDYLRGEQARGCCRLLNTEGMDGGCGYYKCQFGGAPRCRSEQPQQRRSRIAHGESIKRDCQCRFRVSQTEEQRNCVPEVCTIRSYEHRHINSNGTICHGPEDPDVDVHARLEREPFLTEDCRRMLGSFLLRYPDASTESCIIEVQRWLVGRGVVILQDADREQGTEPGDSKEYEERASLLLEQNRPRDWFVGPKDIHNVRSNVARSAWKFCEDEAASVEALLRERPQDLFFNQRQRTRTSAADGLPEDEQPFVVGIMNLLMLAWAVKWGHGRPFVIDSTFGTNSHVRLAYHHGR